MTIEQLTELTQALIEAEENVNNIDLKLKAAKQQAILLREVTLPEAMTERGVQSITLTNGKTLTISQTVYASIPEANRPRAFAWFEAHGFSGMIKSEVKVNFGRNDLEAASKLVDSLQKKGMEPAFKELIHPQTLKAFIRDELKKGTPIPMDLLGARTVNVAKVK